MGKMWMLVVLWLAVAAFTVYGWVSNIIDLVNNFGVETTFKTTMRVIGIAVAPIGIILGWFW